MRSRGRHVQSWWPPVRGNVCGGAGRRQGTTGKRRPAFSPPSSAGSGVCPQGRVSPSGTARHGRLSRRLWSFPSVTEVAHGAGRSAHRCAASWRRSANPRSPHRAAPLAVPEADRALRGTTRHLSLRRLDLGATSRGHVEQVLCAVRYLGRHGFPRRLELLWYLSYRGHPGYLGHLGNLGCPGL